MRRAIASCRGVRKCPRCVYKSQTGLPIHLRQRLAARPAALAPRLLSVRRPRRHGPLRTTLRSRRAMCHIALLARLAPARKLAKMQPATLRRGVRRCLRSLPVYRSPDLRGQRLAAQQTALAPRLFCLRRPRRCPAKMRRALAPRRGVRRCPRCMPTFLHTTMPILLRQPRWPPGLSCPTSSLRPSPAASQGAVALDVATSPRAMPHCVARASHSDPAACEDAARVVAPHRGVRRCPRRSPNSRTILPILRRQRLVARPAALAPQLLCVRRPRRRLAKIRCALAPRCGVRRCPQCSPYSQTIVLVVCLATPRCPASLSRTTSSLRPSPTASWGAVARDDSISPCAMPHCVARTSHSDPAFCKDAARVVALRRGVRRCPGCLANTQAVLPNLRRQCFAARPAALASLLLCVRRPRRQLA